MNLAQLIYANISLNINSLIQTSNFSYVVNKQPKAFDNTSQLITLEEELKMFGDYLGSHYVI